ncbi:MAG: LysM peptidoglycan-binding domain-containing protein, partial [Opitutales bacterium]|nr:LysM peptidoglycan-binding domain-containing protein [Opitutales bacterium]
LEELLQKVQKENLELKQKLDAAIAQADNLRATQKVSVVSQRAPKPKEKAPEAAAAQAPSQASAAAEAPQVGRDTPPTYTVQPGDTLTNISRKVYGKRGRWRDIFDANRDRMATPESLKPGQVLRIPR